VTDPRHTTEISAGELGALVPPGASIAMRDVQVTPLDPLDQIALTWNRGDDPFGAEWGLVIWHPAPGGWRAVYGFTDAARKGVLGIAFRGSGDVTGDGLPELLTFAETGGTGWCGTWRVISPNAAGADELLHRPTCDTELRLTGGTLQRREAVFAPEDPHCCPSSYRTTTFEWDGSAFRKTSSMTETASPA